VHFGWVVARVDGDHIEAKRVVTRQRVCGKDLRGGPGEAASLPSIDRLLRGPEAGVRAKSNFDEAERATLECDKVQLRVAQVQVAG
jgi:hypothetical protein